MPPQSPLRARQAESTRGGQIGALLVQLAFEVQRALQCRGAHDRRDNLPGCAEFGQERLLLRRETGIHLGFAQRDDQRGQPAASRISQGEQEFRGGGHGGGLFGEGVSDHVPMEAGFVPHIETM